MNEKITTIYNQIERFINDESFKCIVRLFNGKTEYNDWKSYLNYLNQFVNIWDYRNNEERFNIKKETFKNEKNLIDAFKKLGFINQEKIKVKPDYIIILGGANLSNYNRSKLAKIVIDENNLKNIKIISLSTNRKIADIEKDFIDTFAPGTNNEYDSLNCALEKIFNISRINKEIIVPNENEYLLSKYRVYEDKYNSNEIISLCSPSSNSKRRANTRDTFKFFLRENNIPENSNILFVTSQIYVNYQYYNLLDLSIKKNLNIQFIGTAMNENDINLKLYLQELKGTINSMYKFINSVN